MVYRILQGLRTSFVYGLLLRRTKLLWKSATTLDQDEFKTALVARPRRFHESTRGLLIRAKLFFEDNIRLEKRLVLFERALNVPGGYVEEFVLE